MNWRDEVIHASDCRCKVCMPEVHCPECERKFNKHVRHTFEEKVREVVITPEEEQAIEEFIEAQFEADLLEEVEDTEVL